MSGPYQPLATLAGCAAQGVPFQALCQACRHRSNLSARSLYERGNGKRNLKWLRTRLWCRKCGGAQVTITIRGHWTGPSWTRPEDWADTVEERMQGGRAKS